MSTLRPPRLSAASQSATRADKFRFPDYGVDELQQIAQLLLEEAGFTPRDAAALDALRALVAPIPREAPCGNARSVENRVAAAISAQSTRLRCAERGAAGRLPEAAQLFELAADDFDAAAAVANRAAGVLPSGVAALDAESQSPKDMR